VLHQDRLPHQSVLFTPDAQAMVTLPRETEKSKMKNGKYSRTLIRGVELIGID
jgi:hypothetical protein